MKLNCLIVAAILWVCGRGHGWIAMRRSDGLRGLIPHFCHISRSGPFLTLIEYSPKGHKQSLCDEGPSPLLFSGQIKVKTYVLVNSEVVKTLSDAQRKARSWM